MTAAPATGPLPALRWDNVVACLAYFCSAPRCVEFTATARGPPGCPRCRLDLLERDRRRHHHCRTVQQYHQHVAAGENVPHRFERLVVQLRPAERLRGDAPQVLGGDGGMGPDTTACGVETVCL
jgi:hypothetical protein